MHAPACLALPFSPLFRSAHTKRLRSLGTSPPHPHLPDPCHASTHPHSTSNITLPLHNPTDHDHPFPTLLLSCAGWYGTPWWRRTREDKSRILVKWFGWRIRCSPPVASAPPTHPNLLISTQRCLSHIAPGNGYSQTVTLCPQMDPPPIPPSHIPPPGG